MRRTDILIVALLVVLAYTYHRTRRAPEPAPAPPPAIAPCYESTAPVVATASTAAAPERAAEPVVPPAPARTWLARSFDEGALTVLALGSLEDRADGLEVPKLKRIKPGVWRIKLERQALDGLMVGQRVRAAEGAACTVSGFLAASHSVPFGDDAEIDHEIACGGTQLYATLECERPLPEASWAYGGHAPRAADVWFSQKAEKDLARQGLERLARNLPLKRDSSYPEPAYTRYQRMAKAPKAHKLQVTKHARIWRSSDDERAPHGLLHVTLRIVSGEGEWHCGGDDLDVTLHGLYIVREGQIVADYREPIEASGDSHQLKAVVDTDGDGLPSLLWSEDMPGFRGFMLDAGPTQRHSDGEPYCGCTC